MRLVLATLAVGQVLSLFTAIWFFGSAKGAREERDAARAELQMADHAIRGAESAAAACAAREFR